MDRYILKESIHAYTHKGEPVEMVHRKTPLRIGKCPACGYVIETKNNKKPVECDNCKAMIAVSSLEVVSHRSVKTNDISEYGLFPSTTRMIKLDEAPFELTPWSIGRHVKCAIELERETGWFKIQPKRWWQEFNSRYNTLREEFSAPGEAFHGLIKKILMGEHVNIQGIDEQILSAIDTIVGWFEARGYRHPICETAYTSVRLGVAGTIDVHCEDLVLDFKSKHTDNSWKQILSGTPSSLRSVAIQIGGYNKILRDHGIHPLHFVVCAVNLNKAHKEYGKVLFREIPKERVEWGGEVIELNAQAWFKQQEYDPREAYNQGLCWSLEEIMNGTKGN